MQKKLVGLAALAITAPLTACHKTSSALPRAHDMKNCVQNIASYGSKTMNVTLTDQHYSITVDLSDKSGLRRLAPALGLGDGDAQPVIVSRSYTYFAPHSDKPEYQAVEKTDTGRPFSSDFSNRLSSDARREGDEIYRQCLSGYNATPHAKLTP